MRLLVLQNQGFGFFFLSRVKKLIEALTNALGPLGMVKFIQQFGGGTGDYTQERKELLAGITMDDFKRWSEEMDKKEDL